MSSVLDVAGLNAYYGSAHVLFDVGLALADSSSTAVLGRNGAGKTTLVRGIMGVECRASGDVLFRGKKIDRLPTHKRASLGLAVVPEDRRIYTRLTVRENLELARRAAGGRDAVTPAELAKTLPMLGPLMDRYGNELSGGEQQAVAIARALVPRPAVLLLDEPSQGLAPVILQEVRQAISSLLAEFGTVVLLTEQNVPFALSLASRVIVIDKGRVVFAGSDDEFRSRRDVQERYLAL